MSYKIITDVVTEPVTLEQARQHCRINAYGSPLSHPDDDYLQLAISSSRNFIEEYLQRSLAEKTIEMALDSFPENEIALELSPIKTILSVKYIDTSSVEQTLSSAIYALDDYSMPNWLLLTNNSEWPQTLDSANNIKIRMTTSDAEIPKSIYAAILLMVGHLYENRQEDVLGNTRISFNSLPMGVKNLIQSYRLGLGV